MPRVHLGTETFNKCHLCYRGSRQSPRYKSLPFVLYARPKNYLIRLNDRTRPATRRASFDFQSFAKLESSGYVSCPCINLISYSSASFVDHAGLSFYRPPQDFRQMKKHERETFLRIFRDEIVMIAR